MLSYPNCCFALTMTQQHFTEHQVRKVLGVVEVSHSSTSIASTQRREHPELRTCASTWPEVQRFSGARCSQVFPKQATSRGRQGYTTRSHCLHQEFGLDRTAHSAASVASSRWPRTVAQLCDIEVHACSLGTANGSFERDRTDIFSASCNLT